MKPNTFFYCVRQGLKNIAHNRLFSLASTATIGACIFLFCLFFALIMNVQEMAKKAETTVGITVFFKSDSSETDIQKLGEEIKERPEVKELTYTSAEQAWSEFKSEYFNNDEDLAAAFKEDNPLADSESFEIYLNSIDQQSEMVSYLQSLPAVRQVNFSNAAVAGLSSVNRIISALSFVIISVLLAVSVFLISNTISVAAQFRRRENEIMKLIGATNFMIRLPFLVEGVLLGFFGALIPLVSIYYIYERATRYVMEHFVNISGLFQPIPIASIFPEMAGAAMGLGVGVGLFVSFITIRKALRV